MLEYNKEFEKLITDAYAYLYSCLDDEHSVFCDKYKATLSNLIEKVGSDYLDSRRMVNTAKRFDHMKNDKFYSREEYDREVAVKNYYNNY